MNLRKWTILFASLLIAVIGVVLVQSQSDETGTDGPVVKASPKKGWKTNTAKRSIELDEIMSGGPPKDGIPAIDLPKFVSVEDAEKWLGPNEPVISLVVDGKARAYPLQILIWHEIVNDRIKGLPVSVTFCPLCYSAIVFERSLGGKTYTFGVTGMLRNSDMIMYDRESESWWQQFSGEAVVGELTGEKLRRLPAQIVGFEQFAKSFPAATILSRETGYERDYGRNPYVGYDNINERPFLFRGKTDGRLRPMEKVIAVELGKLSKAYPYSVTRLKKVIHDRLGSQDLVVFHVDGAASALDGASISKSKDSGASGVFIPIADGKRLRFSFENGKITDRETKSQWNIFGRAISGRLRGKSLKQVSHGDYFAFAWFVFKPDTEVYTVIEK